MPASQLNTTTLSEALAADTNNFTVASTASISVGDLIVCRNEAMIVQSIPVSGRVTVSRGWSGTLAVAQPTGQRIFTGTPDLFKSLYNAAIGIVGDNGTLPQYLTPGNRATDGAGNVYILVDLTATCYSGTTVKISNDGLYTAAPLVGGVQGPVGLLVEQGTSAQYAWAQIFGYNSYAQDATATSDATSAYVPCAATSVSTPDVGMAAISPTSTDQYLINGMFIVGIATSSTTSATSATGTAVPVFLNYPYALAWKVNVIAPTT